MARRKRPLFLERAHYRTTRLRDAARLLPVAGAVLLILPHLWTPPGETARQTSGDTIYFFALWLCLILAAAAFAPGLSSDNAGKDPAAPPGEED